MATSTLERNVSKRNAGKGGRRLRFRKRLQASLPQRHRPRGKMKQTLEDLVRQQQTARQKASAKPPAATPTAAKSGTGIGTTPSKATAPCEWECRNPAHPTATARNAASEETCWRNCGTKAPWMETKYATPRTDPETAAKPCSWNCLHATHGRVENFSHETKCYKGCGTDAPWLKAA